MLTKTTQKIVLLLIFTQTKNKTKKSCMHYNKKTEKITHIFISFGQRTSYDDLVGVGKVVARLSCLTAPVQKKHVGTQGYHTHAILWECDTIFPKTTQPWYECGIKLHYRENIALQTLRRTMMVPFSQWTNFFCVFLSPKKILNETKTKGMLVGCILGRKKMTASFLFHCAALV